MSICSGYTIQRDCKLRNARPSNTVLGQFFASDLSGSRRKLYGGDWRPRKHFKLQLYRVIDPEGDFGNTSCSDHYIGYYMPEQYDESKLPAEARTRRWTNLRIGPGLCLVGRHCHVHGCSFCDRRHTDFSRFCDGDIAITNLDNAECSR
jgi:hypothetical protein